MKNKAILKEYIVTYKCSTSKSGESQTDSWRKKYLGLIGVLYIIKSVHKQYFLFFSILILIFVFSKLNSVIAYLKYVLAYEIEYSMVCLNFCYDDMSRE